MTGEMKMSKLPDCLKGLDVQCGWCSEVFLYNNLQDHVHFRGVHEIDYDRSTNKVLPLDERGIPITQDPDQKAAIYSQEQPDPPDNFLDGITSTSLAIIKCVERHKGLYDPTLKWNADAKMTTYGVIALNINESLKLSGTEKLTGQIVKTKWENMRKGLSRALMNKNTYQYASDLQFVKKYLRSTHTEMNDDKKSWKRKLSDCPSNVHGESENKRIRIGITSNSSTCTPSTSHQPVGSQDETLSEVRKKCVISAKSNKELTAAEEASLSFLSKSSQLQSLEDKVTSAAKATLKQATHVIHEETSGSFTEEHWSSYSLTIREAILTIPHDNLLLVVNGIIEIMQKYMKKDG